MLPRYRAFVSLIPSLFLMSLTVQPVEAQTPLDMRIMNERLGQLERQIQNLQASPSVEIQTPLAPSDTGTIEQVVPTDVASRLQVRVLQLERLVETLTGQIEETRFEVSRMRAELQQMSNDVAYRLAVLEQAAGVSSAVAAPQGVTLSPQVSVAPVLQENQISVSGSVPGPTNSLTNRATDAPAGQTTRLAPNFDMPMSAPVQRQPLPQAETIAPGVPASVTTQIAPGAVHTAPPNTGPVNQGSTFGVLRTDSAGTVLPPAPVTSTTSPPPQQLPAAPTLPPTIQPAPTGGPVATARIGAAPSPTTAFVALPVGTPKEQYDYAFDILRQADYASAETALRMFLEANASDDLAGNAQYWLGETYYVRGDFEQAAVEFLSGYQTYPSSAKAPDNLLKLGLSMARLGQTDGACTALTRLATEYPSANDTIRRRAQTERARLKCS